MNAYMKHSLLLFAAAGVLTCTGTAQAANREVDAYLARASAVASEKVIAAGVTAPEGLKVKARVDSDGRLTAIRVVSSSGALETDIAATKALRNLRVAQPPVVLIGADVNVAIGPAYLLTARMP